MGALTMIGNIFILGVLDEDHDLVLLGHSLQHIKVPQLRYVVQCVAYNQPVSEDQLFVLEVFTGHPAIIFHLVVDVLLEESILIVQHQDQLC